MDEEVSVLEYCHYFEPMAGLIMNILKSQSDQGGCLDNSNGTFFASSFFLFFSLLSTVAAQSALVITSGQAVYMKIMKCCVSSYCKTVHSIVESRRKSFFQNFYLQCYTKSHKTQK